MSAPQEPVTSTSTVAPRTGATSRRFLRGVTLISGATAVIEFALPLYLGATLAATASQTGLLVSTALVATVISRFLVGLLVDRQPPQILASAGALIYAAACAGYATATLASAFAFAALSGVATALIWVSVSTVVGRRLHIEPAGFVDLFSSQQAGNWVIFTPAIILLAYTNYTALFYALAVAALVAAIYLVKLPAPPSYLLTQQPGQAPRNLRGQLPLLIAVAAMVFAEAGVSLLLLLQLYRHFDLGAAGAALVFLPGAIAMSMLPRLLNRAVSRFGKKRMTAVAGALTGLFAVLVLHASSPAMIAFLWILAAIGWAIIVPLQQTTATEGSNHATIGRSLSRVQISSLIGGALGAFTAGFVFESSNRDLLVFVFAALALVGAALTAKALSSALITT